MTAKRVTAFAGHYGSGKTHLALNFALRQRVLYPDRPVILADLDIVNPYYRTHDARGLLEAHGVVLIASAYAGSNAELPAMPPDAVRAFDDKTFTAVLDVGGDDRGALALGRYAARMRDSADADMLFVFNTARPLTGTAHDALEVLREIEEASHVRFTGVVNNTNLGRDTTPELVLRSHATAQEICAASGLALRFTAAQEDLADALRDVGEVFPLRLFAREAWARYSGDQ